MGAAPDKRVILYKIYLILNIHWNLVDNNQKIIIKKCVLETWIYVWEQFI